MTKINRSSKLPLEEVETLRRMHESRAPLVAFGDDGIVRVLDAGSGRWLGEIRTSGRSTVRTLAFHPARRALFAGTENGAVFRWSLGEEIPERRAMRLPLQPVTHLSLTRDGQVLGASRGSRDRAIETPSSVLHDATTLEVLREADASRSGSYCHGFSPDGTQVVCCIAREKWQLECRRVTDWSLAWSAAGSMDRVAWCAQQRVLACWSVDGSDGRIRFISERDGSSLGAEVRPVPASGAALCVSSDERWLLAHSEAGAVAWLWSLPGLLERRGAISPDDAGILLARFDAGDRWLGAAIVDKGSAVLAGVNRVQWLELPSGRVIASHSGRGARCVAVSPPFPQSDVLSA